MADLKTQHAQNIKLMTQLFQEGKIATMISELYAKDCKILVPGMDTPVEGNDNPILIAALNKYREDGAVTFAIDLDELLDLGEVAVERSHFKFIKADGTTLSQGQSVIVWKKIAEKWFVYIDIFNQSA